LFLHAIDLVEEFELSELQEELGNLLELCEEGKISNLNKGFILNAIRSIDK
jgi:hypothetical protein